MNKLEERKVLQEAGGRRLNREGLIMVKQQCMPLTVAAVGSCKR